MSNGERIGNRFPQVEAVKWKTLPMPSPPDTFSCRATRSEPGKEKRITNGSFCAQERSVIVLVS